MNNGLTVTATITVNAPASKVWSALTEPDIIKDYLYGTKTETDWEVGSEIIFQGEYNGQTYRDKGMVLENDPGTRISYTYWSAFTGLADEPENYSLITYVVTPKGANETEFSWIQKGFGTDKSYEQTKNNMPSFIEQVKVIMER